MDRELIKKLDEFIKVRLHEKRYRHTMGVVETATALADRYGADPDKTYIAALFHDACKNLDIEEMNSLVEKYHLDEVYIDKPQLAHSKLAAEILQDKFGITDQDIINAVSYHTTGRANMGLLEKIIYVADYMEPNRDFPGVERLRELAVSDIDGALMLGLEMTLEHLRRQGSVLSPESAQALEYLKSHRKG